MTRPRRFAALAVIVLLVVAVAEGYWSARVAGSARSLITVGIDRTAVAARANDQAGRRNEVPGPGRPVDPGSTPRGMRPVRIRIPAIDVDASVTDLGIAPDGSIAVPTVPSQAGWLAASPAPGQRGPAVIAGHVDSTTGPAVFYRLSSLRAGDEIDVTLRNGSTAVFEVDAVRRYPQRQFPTTAVYGPVPAPVLRLVTCGGAYDPGRGGYQDNVVAFAS